MTATLTFSERRRMERAEEDRERLVEQLTTERTSLIAKTESLEAEIAKFDDAAKTLLAAGERIAEIPSWIFTTGRNRGPIGGIAQQEARGLAALAVDEGLGWLSAKRERSEEALKKVQARLAVVEKELPAVQ